MTPPETQARARRQRVTLRFLITGVGVATAAGVAAVFGVHYDKPPRPGPATQGIVTTPGQGHSQRFTPANVRGTLPPRQNSYLGVYVPTVPHSYGGVASFSAATGQKINLALYYSAWDVPFLRRFADMAYAHGAVPVIQIDPRHVDLPSIAQGRYDGYLAAYAADVRSYGKAVVLSFGHEMNGVWEPWGYRHVSPDVFVAVWRHIVTLFRADGADNVTWLWTVNLIGRGSNPKRPGGRIDAIAPWWPGGSYVSWVGLDGYYYTASQRFKTLFGPTIRAVRKLTDDPILVAETGVSPTAGKDAKIRNLFAGVRRNHLLGLIWFDAIGNRDWRLDLHPRALAEFRQDAAGYPGPGR